MAQEGGTSGGFSMGNYGWIGESFASHQERQSGTQQSTVTKGEGDVAMLKKLLEEMSSSLTPEGMQATLKGIFKAGYESQMPTLLSKATSAGIRPQDATTQTLLENDLMARLTGEGAKALTAQQQAYGDLASRYAQLTEKPVVTTVQGQGKVSGSTDAWSTLGNIFGF